MTNWIKAILFTCISRKSVKLFKNISVMHLLYESGVYNKLTGLCQVLQGFLVNNFAGFVQLLVVFLTARATSAVSSVWVYTISKLMMKHGQCFWILSHFKNGQVTWSYLSCTPASFIFKSIFSKPSNVCISILLDIRYKEIYQVHSENGKKSSKSLFTCYQLVTN